MTKEEKDSKGQVVSKGERKKESKRLSSIQYPASFRKRGEKMLQC